MYALVTVSGRDRPGIVRDLAAALVPLSVSIEDSTMTTLRGRFVVMMWVRAPQGVSFSELAAALAELERQTGLDVHLARAEGADAEAEPPEADLRISVQGADRVGIVHAVAEAIAAEEGSIVDMATRVVHGEPQPRYMMVLDVATSGRREAIAARLDEVGKRLGVQVEVSPIAPAEPL